MSKKIQITLLNLMFTALIFAQTTTKYSQNSQLDFEKVESKNTLPFGWLECGNGYEYTIDSIIKKHGDKSLAIVSTKNKVLNSFGCITYQLPADYDGKEIELSGFLKLKEVSDGYAGLFLRIDGISSVLQFNNMEAANLTGTSDWKNYSIKLPYPVEAKSISIGAILTGQGQVNVDNFQIFIDGKNINTLTLEKKKLGADLDNEFDVGSQVVKIDLNKNKKDNLKFLGIVWGFLKYYHPNISSGNYNWDNELFRILPKILKAENKSQRNLILLEVVNKLGSFETADRNESSADLIKFGPDLEWISDGNLGSKLMSQLIKIKTAKRNDNNYYVSLTAGIGNPDFKNELEYSYMKYPDAGYRLLSLYRYWNIIQYYFPYKNLIKKDWKNILEEFIPKFINSSNELEYKLVVLELIGRVNDTHANIWSFDKTLQTYKGLNYAPTKLLWVDEKIVVTSYFDEILGQNSGLKRGDVISHINKKSIKKIIHEKLKYTPGSNYATKLRDITNNLLRTSDSIIEIKYERKGISFTKNVHTYSPEKLNLYSNPKDKDTCFKYLTPKIAYLYPGTIKDIYIPKIITSIENSKGLIVDLRCYPSEFIVFSLGNYLIPDSISFAKFTIGSVKNPGLFHFTTPVKIGGSNSYNYKGKVVILVNEMTQSQAEYTAMAFRAAPNAKIIGSMTAGADGNVSSFYLPGGIRTMISGIGIYYPDGKETQGVGIIPDISVKPTLAGITANRDEILEKAIEFLENDKF